MVNTGIRMLVKHAPPDAKCHYRPCQEVQDFIPARRTPQGHLRSRSDRHCRACVCVCVREKQGLEWLYPYMTKRLVTVSFDDMAKLILEDTPFMTSFTPETQAQLEPLGSWLLLAPRHPCWTNPHLHTYW